MKYFFLAALFTAALLLSCSASNDDGEGGRPVKAFELEEKIIGKWDVKSREVENRSEQKQATNLCYIFSLIFNADGSFIIIHQDGTLTGEYEVVGENLISLGDAGEIGEIRFSSSGIGFVARLDDICMATLSAMRDDEYSPGACFSFLKCQDETVWVSREEDSVVFLQFENQPRGEFFVRKSFFTAQRCQTYSDNHNGNTTMVLIANYTNVLRFILEKASPDIYTYTLLENGKLQEELKTTEETRTRIFEPASETEIEPYDQYVICGEKTWVPDDSFEKWLIQFGYDDVMDDYVLTENINKLETLWLNESYLYGGWEFVDLTGLQDFVALKDFEVQAAKLPEIDLSGNINLERLFLGSPLIISLDLTVNTKLRNLYVEFAQLSMLDLSNNSELVSVELQLMPLPSLDISMNNKLEMLTIEGGEFKNLTAGEHPVLWHLNISDNKEFAAVDINHFPNVKELILSNNKLTAVDLSVLQDLEILEVQENFLSGLDLSNNESLYYLSAAKNPDLYCIKVSQVHLDRMAEENPFMSWSKDETASYSLECP